MLALFDTIKITLLLGIVVLMMSVMSIQGCRNEHVCVLLVGAVSDLMVVLGYVFGMMYYIIFCYTG